MMWTKIYAKILLAFLVCLTPVSLVSCDQFYNNNSNNTSQKKSQYFLENKSYIINDLDKLIDELDELISDFSKKIQGFKDEKNKSPKLGKLKKDADKIYYISSNIKKTIDENFKPNNYKTLITEDIEQKNDNLLEIIEPLSKENNIKNVQQELNIPNLNGQLDKETRNKIASYLTENRNSLIKNNNPLQNGFLIDNLNQQVQELQDKNNKLDILVWTSLIMSSISLLLFATLLSERRSYYTQRRARQQDGNNREGSRKKSNTSLNNLSYEINRLESKVDNYEYRIQQLEANLSQNIVISRPGIDISPNPDRGISDITEQKQPSSSNLNQSLPGWLANYNNVPGAFYSEAIKVSLTQESIEKIRLGSVQKVIFETNERGSYWILKEQNIHYLVPKKHLTFNEYQYTTAQALFQCQGYQRSSRQKFYVRKPAKVTSIFENNWQLEEIGILEFY